MSYATTHCTCLPLLGWSVKHIVWHKCSVLPLRAWKACQAALAMAGTWDASDMASCLVQELGIESTNLSGTLPATIAYSRSLARLTLSNTKLRCGSGEHLRAACNTQGAACA